MCRESASSRSSKSHTLNKITIKVNVKCIITALRESKQEEQKQEESVENTTEQKINPVQEEVVDDKNGDIEA